MSSRAGGAGAGAVVRVGISEAELMRGIMLALSEEGHFVARAQVGLFYTRDGRPIRSGLPVGFSDLFGHRAGDAKAFYLEVKTSTGRATPEQMLFIEAMRQRGAIAAVVRSVEEALKAVRGST